MKKNNIIIIYNAFCVVLSFTLSILNAYWKNPGWAYTFAALAVANGICIITLKQSKK